MNDLHCKNTFRKTFEEMNITFSSDRYIEFNSKEADKKGRSDFASWRAFRNQAGRNHRNRRQRQQFPMIKAAGLGVSVANGREFVKEIADYVTEADNNHDPVAEVIEKFID